MIPPSVNKKGWPWGDQSSAFPDSMPDGSEWPKISIVTPSYNQGRFLEATIRSVILQNYPNLEYFIVDGGSNDDSLTIIKKYEPWITSWISEKDEGQSDAINKGFRNSTGGILGWINSDDLYCKGAFKHVASTLKNDIPQWLVGATEVVDSEDMILREHNPFPVTSMTFSCWTHRYVHQQGIFWNRKMFEKMGGEVNKDLHYIMDFDLWYRMNEVSDPILTKYLLARYRHHGEAKTIAEWDKSAEEMVEWYVKKYKSGVSGENLLREFIKQSVESQRYLERISDHFLFGKLIRFWGKWINPRFRVLDKCRISITYNYYKIK
jgi:glycosyltransferase involved in cell wall biosynthesis